jgi:ABC-type transporter Mla subunit MlaD
MVAMKFSSVSFALVSCLFLTSIFSALGQTSQPSPAAQPPAPQTSSPQSSDNDNGVAAEWDTRKLLDSLSQQAERLKPVIDQVQPANWQSKGASETYVAQSKAVEAQLKYLLASADAFSRQPERLPLGLDAYFRMQALESSLGSLVEGVRKYQNPALASLMQSLLAENSTNRDRLRQYLQDLATQKEQEFEVADREAQRCRAALLQQPTPKTKKVAHP